MRIAGAAGIASAGHAVYNLNMKRRPTLRRGIRFCMPVVALLCVGMMLGGTSACGGHPEPDEDALMASRHRMVDTDIQRRGVTNPAVLQVMREVPRHEFVLPQYRRQAYVDSPLPIDAGQTISQPFIVAAMTEAVDPQPTDVVLEIGTGSGYQAAVLSPLVKHVYTIEIVEELARSAEAKLERLGYENVTVRHGNGFLGWPEAAPFDCIVVTAAPEEVPQPLIDQLKPGGRLVIPVGPVRETQQLLLLTKDQEGEVHRRMMMPVRFVPMTGRPEE